MAELENKGFDNPQPSEDNTTIVPKANGVQNPTPIVQTTAPQNTTSSDGPTTSTDTDKPTVATTTTNDRGADTSGSDRKIKTLQDFLDRMEQPETAEQRKKRERREKSAKIVSAISDGIRAISNLYFTSQYAPNAYNHEKDSQLNAQSTAIEKAKKDREANADRYLKFALALGDAENERAKTVRETEAQQEARRLALEKAQREQDAANRAAVLLPDKQREQKGKADRAGYEAETARAKAGKAGELAQAEVDAKRAAAQSSRARAASYGRANRQVDHHFNGKTYPNGSNDYEKDVREAARLYNERHKNKEGFVPIVIDRNVDTAYGRRVQARKAEEYAGEVETRLAKEREDNAPPSRRSNNNEKTPPSRR